LSISLLLVVVAEAVKLVAAVVVLADIEQALV
jgi:hypothetical protein